ncbi:hypothetical protein ATCC90586_004623 [Pythium insidiosum]|nr:hypothetical protein ATCC90586_004623 [Pythium insidiosum]
MAEYKMKYHENGLPKNWDGKDWDTYKRAMTNFFAEQDLLDTVEKKDQDAKKENKVRMYIDMSVPPSVAAQLREANTGSDMWETLCEVYETKKDAIRRLRSELENMSFRLGGDMNLHLSQMFNKKRELEQLGFKVHDIEMIDLMLKTADAHVTGNRDYFVTFEEFSKGYDVTASGVFPDVKGRVEGIGTVALVTEVNGKKVRFYVDEVLYLPGARYSLLSSGLAEEQGFEYEMMKDGEVLLNAEKCGLSYKFYSFPAGVTLPEDVTQQWPGEGAMLLGDASGKRYSPFLVFKTTKSTIPAFANENDEQRHVFGIRFWRQFEPLQASGDMQIYDNPTAWWNADLSMAFLNYHFGHRKPDDPMILLLWDDFSGHWTDEVAARAIELRVKVPPKFTYVCQPADISWNKPLKDHMRAHALRDNPASKRGLGPQFLTAAMVKYRANFNVNTSALSRLTLPYWATLLSSWTLEIQRIEKDDMCKTLDNLYWRISVKRVWEAFYWHNMYRDVERYVKEYVDCSTAKGRPGHLDGFRNATASFPSGKHVATAFVLAKAAQAYDSTVFQRFGASSVVRHDRDPRFMTEVFAPFRMMISPKQRATLACRPQANGQQERSVQTVIRCARAYIESAEQDDWEDAVMRLLFAINTSVDATRRETPFFVVHGWDARSTVSVMLAPSPQGRDKLDAYV